MDDLGLWRVDMIQVKSKLKGFLALGVMFAGARIGMADIIVSDPIPSDGLTQSAATGEFQYDVELTPELVKAGDGLVIYDFPGLITSGPHAPALSIPGFTFNVVQSLTGNGLSASSPSLNANPPGNQVDAALAGLGSTADNPAINNVSIVYNGGGTLGPAADVLGVLTLYSSVAGAGVTLNPDSATGSKDSSGPVSSPTEIDSGLVTVPVPEPTCLGLLGAVGLIVGSGRRARRSIV